MLKQNQMLAIRHMNWIGCGSAFTSSSWIGLDWVTKLMDWIGLDLENWTHVQLCAIHLVLALASALALAVNALAVALALYSVALLTSL